MGFWKIDLIRSRSLCICPPYMQRIEHPSLLKEAAQTQTFLCFVLGHCSTYRQRSIETGGGHLKMLPRYSEMSDIGPFQEFRILEEFWTFRIRTLPTILLRYRFLCQCGCHESIYILLFLGWGCWIRTGIICHAMRVPRNQKTPSNFLGFQCVRISRDSVKVLSWHSAWGIFLGSLIYVGWLGFLSFFGSLTF